MLNADEYYYENGVKVKLIPQSTSTPRILVSVPITQVKYYTNHNNIIVGVDDTIIASCKKDNRCIDDIKSQDIKMIKLISNNIYLITINNKNEIFNISNTLYELGSFKYVHPNFYKKKALR